MMSRELVTISKNEYNNLRKRIKLLEKAKSIWESYCGSVYFANKDNKVLDKIEKELVNN